MEVTKGVKADTKYKLLVAFIDKDWSSDYFINYFEAISSLEAYFTAKMSVWKYEVEEDLRHISFFDHGLRVKSIKYNSPGWIEVILSASVITAIIALVKHYVPNKKEITATKKIAAEVTRIEIDNLKAMGYTDKEIRVYLEPKFREVLVKVERLEFLMKLGSLLKLEEKDWDGKSI